MNKWFIFLVLMLVFLLPVPALAEGEVRHKIHPGDTLIEISEKFSCSVQEIARVNNISDPNLIKAGEKLLIPTSKSWIWEGVGDATWYGEEWTGRKTRNGEVFDPNSFTAASNTLQMGTFARITNTDNGKTVVVWVNDTGGFTRYGIKIDLSRRAFEQIADLGEGRVKVRIEALE